MKLGELLSDEKFISEILPLDSVEEVQAAFKEREVELTIEQCEKLGAEIKRIIDATDRELEKASGGGGDSFRQGVDVGLGMTPIGQARRIAYKIESYRKWNNDIDMSNMVGGIIGSGISLGATVAVTIGAYELIKFAGKKVGDWIKDRKTKSCEGT